MSDKYKNYDNKNITLANLKIVGLPDSLEIGEDKFVVKSEFHITLLGVKSIADSIDSNGTEKLQQEIVDEFYNFVSETPLTEYKLSDELRLVNVKGNKTVVVLASVRGIEKLFKRLSEKYGVQPPVQPTHITLYTLPTDTIGIPISSYDELKEISEPIELPGIQKLLS